MLARCFVIRYQIRGLGCEEVMWAKDCVLGWKMLVREGGWVRKQGAAHGVCQSEEEDVGMVIK